MRRIALLPAALLVFGTFAPQVAPMSLSPANAVNWNVDYDGQTITVDVKMAFYANCTQSTIATVNNCQEFVSTGPMQRAVNAIMSAWNGHSYKCFKFIVKVEATAVESAADVPANTMAIDLGSNMTAYNPAYTDGLGPHDPLGTDPSDSIVPQNDPNDPSSWSLVATAAQYVHEFGHILGLDDNYVDDGGGKGHIYPGANEDAMYANGPNAGVVSQDMVDRAVQRSGKVDDSKVKCAMSMDIAPTSLDLLLAQIKNFTLHAYTCDYDPVTTDPKHPPKPMHFTGTLSYGGSILEGQLGPSNATVSFPVSFDLPVPANGPGPVIITPSSDLVLTNQFVWTGDGLIAETGPFFVNGISSSSLDLGSQGSLALSATVTHGAPECPK